MSGYFYSPTLHAFLVDGLHHDRPDDCIPITDETYEALLQGQSRGLPIVFDQSLMLPISKAPVVDDSTRLQILYAEKRDEINLHCEQAIVAGFWSSALGNPFFYDSRVEDQLNLNAVIQIGKDSSFPCRDDDGDKQFRAHTAVQLLQVGEDFNLLKLHFLKKATDLKQSLDRAYAAVDFPAIAAVRWEVEPS
ncbi:hypothetical protein [Pseudomonas sp. F3-2]|uniref:DUF4376 domain-containing protein n=1 Tax=Pseudomonas sp. F3-2 TaxID=3141539 RepID=UPI00315D2325